MTDSPEPRAFAYVGNWRIDGDGLGISICDYDAERGELTQLRTVFPGIVVGAIHIDQERGLLYCSDERSDNPDIGPGGGGRVYVFRIDPDSGDLAELNHASALGALTSFVCPDSAGEYLLATNHAKFTRITTAARDEAGHLRVVAIPDPASTVLFRLRSDGSIERAVDIHVHDGVGPAPKFHPPASHCVVAAPDDGVFVVCDKGTDEILLFRIDADRDALELIGRYHQPEGSSPRYARFSPKAPLLYVNHENEPFVSVFRYESGGLEPISRVEALPADGSYAGRPAQQSDLCVSSDGTRVYDLIREVNAVSVFEADPSTGALTLLQTVQLDGQNPRGCALSPDGQFLLVAQVGSGDVATLTVDEGGLLSDSGIRSTFTRPGNVAFYTP